MWLRGGHGKEKSHDFAFWKFAYNKKHTHFFSQSGEKETVQVDLLYYDNVKPVSDLVLTQELRPLPCLPVQL